MLGVESIAEDIVHDDASPAKGILFTLSNAVDWEAVDTIHRSALTLEYTQEFVEVDFLRYHHRFMPLAALVIAIGVGIPMSILTFFTTSDLLIRLTAVALGVALSGCAGADYFICFRKKATSLVEETSIALSHERFCVAFVLISEFALAVLAYATAKQCLEESRPFLGRSEVSEEHRQAVCVHSVWPHLLWMPTFPLLVGRPRLKSCLFGMLFSLLFKYVVRQARVVDSSREMLSKLAIDLFVFVLIGFFQWMLGVRFREHFEVIVRLHNQRKHANQKRRKTDELLRIVFPGKLYAKLTDGVHIDTSQEASVFTAEIDNFSQWCCSFVPDRAVALLSTLCRRIDACVARSHDIEKIRSAGDRLLVTSNLIESTSLHAQCTARFACLIRTVFDDLSIPVKGSIHSGALIGAVLGSRFVRYDVLGSSITTVMQLLLYSNSGIGFIASESAHTGYCKEVSDTFLRTVETAEGVVNVYVLSAVLPQNECIPESTVPAQYSQSDGGRVAAVRHYFRQSPSRSSIASSHTCNSKTIDPLIAKEHEKLVVVSSWCLWLSFVSIQQEKAFQTHFGSDHHVQVVQPQQRTAFGGTLFFSLMLLACLIVNSEYSGHAGAWLIFLASMFSVAQFMMSYCFRKDPKKVHGVQLIIFILNSTTVYIGAAMSRPSYIGNRTTFIVTFLTVPLFLVLHTSWIMSSLFVLFLFIPPYVGSMYVNGGVWMISDIVLLGFLELTLFVAFRARDSFNRQEFHDIALLRTAVKLEDDEEAFYTHILQARLPKCLAARVQQLQSRGQLEDRFDVESLGETVVISLRLVIPDSVSRMTTEMVALLQTTSCDVERQLAQCTEVSLLQMEGDLATIVGPLEVRKGGSRRHEERLKKAVLETVALCEKVEGKVTAAIALDSCYSVLVVVQHPSASIFGKAVSVARALLDAAACKTIVATQGFAALWRVFSREASDRTMDDPVNFPFSPTFVWRVRGLGACHVHLINFKQEQTVAHSHPDNEQPTVTDFVEPLPNENGEVPPTRNPLLASNEQPFPFFEADAEIGQSYAMDFVSHAEHSHSDFGKRQYGGAFVSALVDSVP